ncbi:uncharacterized protein G2W53_044131 [Senna tora]|uniref:Uncharacterized protein n=1 Tax=Senna tora TaxID=362788 RepID=A0A834SMC3_9FABA|nr:uncharacterized protein G2W53_044131 [Senna tora]
MEKKSYWFNPKKGLKDTMWMRFSLKLPGILGCLYYTSPLLATVVVFFSSSRFKKTFIAESWFCFCPVRPSVLPLMGLSVYVPSE